MKTKRVKESGEPLHYNKDSDSEDCPESERDHDSDGVKVLVEVHPQPILHDHVPQNLRQLCEKDLICLG